MDSSSKIAERLVVALAHCIEFNVNVHFLVSRHKIVLEFCKKCFEQEDLEFVTMNLVPTFPAGIFQNSHHLHDLPLFSNVFVCDIVTACNLELLEYFGIKISRVEDRAFAPFLLTNSNVFLWRRGGHLVYEKGEFIG